LNIRSAGNEDAASIAVILNAFITTTTYEWTETQRTIDEVLDWVDEHEVVLVAEVGGEVVGLAAYGWFRDAVKRPGYRFTVENTVHVREDHWRSGIAGALMRALIEEARTTGKHAMIAAIDASNEVSVRFHERLGFVEVARMPQVGEKFGKWCDLILLELILDGRDDPGVS
jgi:L-amino acid N-acyltransferase YncA